MQRAFMRVSVRWIQIKEFLFLPALLTEVYSVMQQLPGVVILEADGKILKIKFLQA